MKCVIVLLSSVLLVGVSLAQEDRAESRPDFCSDSCDTTSCTPISEVNCIAETISDPCGCCTICAKVLDERCGGAFWQEGRCGADYYCDADSSPTTKDAFADARADGETGLCKCRPRTSSDAGRVCGTDDVLYDNQCALNVASRKLEIQGQRPITEAADGGRCKYGK